MSHLNYPYLGISSIVVLITMMAFQYLNKQKQDFKSIRLILTSLIFVLLHTLFGLIGYLKNTNPFTLFIVTQVFAIITGIFFYNTFIKKYGKKFNYPMLSAILLQVFVMVASGLLFSVVFDYTSERSNGWYFSFAFFTFIIPYFFFLTFEASVAIPVPIYKVWYYPEFPNEIDLDNLDLNRVKVLELEFLKNLNETNTTNFKAKAPEELLFSDWFCMFIQNYNDKYENNPIITHDTMGKAYGWVFYIKPGIFGSKKFIDPELTISQNNLTEKHIIVCRRVENA
jgi:hypothetical protein